VRASFAWALCASLALHAVALAWLWEPRVAVKAPAPRAWIELREVVAEPIAEAIPKRVRAPAEAPPLHRERASPPASAPIPVARSRPEPTLEPPRPESTFPPLPEEAPASLPLDPSLPEVAAASVATARAESVSALGDLQILRRRTPGYPRDARLRGIEGVSLLRVEVERRGRVGDVRIERSAGDDGLDAAAQRAIHRWRFAPFESRSTSSLWVLIPIEFRLR
jgi:protein TonB